MIALVRGSWVGLLSAVLVPCLLLIARQSAAAEPTLDVAIVGQVRQFGRDELLHRPDAASVAVTGDVAYGKAMTYRAVPLAALLADFHPPADTVIDTVAIDGFVGHVPFASLTNADPAKAVPWLAIEPADEPWPQLPGKTSNAGPFYIVWTGALAAKTPSEYWVFQLKKLESQPSPLLRWPALDVDAGVPATDSKRAGLALFVTQCLPCHTLDGAGASSLGPDLNRPMNPTRYMTPEGLRALIRNPKSVRSWPAQQMPGFAPDKMTDRDINSIIDYLAYMASRGK
jgi:mono/diheme cytochrome c family protein